MSTHFEAFNFCSKSLYFMKVFNALKYIFAESTQLTNSCACLYNRRCTDAEYFVCIISLHTTLKFNFGVILYFVHTMKEI